MGRYIREGLSEEMAFAMRPREQRIGWARAEGREFVKEGTIFPKTLYNREVEFHKVSAVLFYL